MAHKLTLTRKYQIIERRDGDEDLTTELTDDATLNVFETLEDIASSAIVRVFSTDLDDIHLDDFVFYLSDAQLEALKESVDIDGFELEEVED